MKKAVIICFVLLISITLVTGCVCTKKKNQSVSTTLTKEQVRSHADGAFQDLKTEEQKHGKGME